MNKRIYLCLAHMSEAGMEQKYVKEAFDTNWVVPLGPNVNGFEDDLKQFVAEVKSDEFKVKSELASKEVGHSALARPLYTWGCWHVASDRATR